MEEDIKILEKLISIYQELKQDFEEGHESSYEMQFEDFKAIENLIKGYKLEKLKNILDEQSLKETLEDYIPKSKIKEKIEELEKYIYKGENAPQDFLQYRIKAKIQVLQELMEDK